MTEMKKISIISVFNDRRILEENLLKNLKNQSIEYDLILIDNTKNVFQSVASAMNFGAQQASTKYLMFVHQDVVLLGNDWLENAIHILEKIDLLGVAGIAGMGESGKTNKDRGRGNVTSKNCNGKIENWCWANPISKPEIVQTLDEFLLIVPQNVFSRLMFDDQTCDRWELFGVDYCLTIQDINLKAYVIPLEVEHNSIGRTIGHHYFKALKRIFRKHGAKHKKIYTTCGDWDVRLPIHIQRIYQIWKWMWQVKIIRQYEYRN